MMRLYRSAFPLLGITCFSAMAASAAGTAVQGLSPAPGARADADAFGARVPAVVIRSVGVGAPTDADMGGFVVPPARVAVADPGVGAVNLKSVLILPASRVTRRLKRGQRPVVEPGQEGAGVIQRADLIYIVAVVCRWTGAGLPATPPAIPQTDRRDH